MFKAVGRQSVREENERGGNPLSLRFVDGDLGDVGRAPRNTRMGLCSGSAPLRGANVTMLQVLDAAKRPVCRIGMAVSDWCVDRTCLNANVEPGEVTFPVRPEAIEACLGFDCSQTYRWVMVRI